MKKAFLIISVLLLSSCYEPGAYPPPPKLQAMDHLESFRTFFLEGRNCDAEIVFNQATVLLTRIDDICGLSDAYVQNYLLHAYAGTDRKKTLDSAREYASIGGCSGELARIRQLDEKTGPSASGPNDIYRSVILRKAASGSGDRAKIDEALAIDRSHGWTLFTILDLDLLKSLSTDEAEKGRIQKRIDLLRTQIQNCD